jgi:tripartite ATP-independent transporter DctP family solute receptor
MTLLARTTVLFLLLWGLPVQATTVLTLAHVYAPEHPSNIACQFFADEVKTRSQGRLLVEISGDASLGDETSILKALMNGSLDLSVNSQGPTAAFVPEFGALGLPFLFLDAETVWRVLDGPVGQQLAQRSATKGLVVLGFWDSGLRHFSNSVRPLLAPADFVGLKFRTPPDPVTAGIVEALGGKPQEVKFSDLYSALQHETVDGQENPLIVVQTARLYEVQKYFSLTGHKYSTTHLLLSKRAWDRLSARDREIVLAAAKASTRYQRTLTQNVETETYNALLARGVRFNKVDTKPFIAATAPIYDQWYASPIGDYVRAVVQAARNKP